ncbi:MAG TPA: SpoIID/LytB domain-containing protein [Polyangiaceae bacterium]|nr:SpoIID/LytB domain-containing protein [Polyangiaceae bacterium]
MDSALTPEMHPLGNLLRFARPRLALAGLTSVGLAVACAPATGDSVDDESTPGVGRSAERVGKLQSAHCSITVKGKGAKDTETDYIARVIACENTGAGLQALKAQAIAARSVAYYEMESKGSICDGQGCQVYTCSNQPQAVHFQAAAETAQQYLANSNMLTYAFYVSGDSNVSGPDCQDVGGSLTKYVTFNDGKTGKSVTQTKLGYVGPAGFGQNRGCASQHGMRCLENAGRDYAGILRFYYGADIEIVTAPGACAVPTQPDPNAPDPNAPDPNAPDPNAPDPNAPAPDPQLGPGSCQGQCGSSQPVPASEPACYCDTLCTDNGDCCGDYQNLCGGGSPPTPPNPSPNPPASGGSCVGACNSPDATSAGCYCDSACLNFGDCCADFTAVCS